MSESDNQIDNQAQRKFKITYLIVILACIVALVAFVLVEYTRITSYQALLPAQSLKKLEAELQRYRQINGHFPKDFREINQSLWHKVPGLHLELDPATWQKDYYYYRIVPGADPNQFILWAVPFGKRRAEAESYFVVMTPTWRRCWKGPALPEGKVGAVKSVPAADTLALFQMSEVKAVYYK